MNRQINPRNVLNLRPFTNLVHSPWRGAGFWAAIGLFATMALIARTTSAAVTEAWVQRYHAVANTDNYNGGEAVAVDGNGNVVVTGISTGSGGGGTYDYYTAK